MVERKNISIEKKYLKMLEPFIKENNNNFSAAIRDTIEIAAKAIEKYGDKDKAIKKLSEKDKEKSELEKSISSGKNIVIPSVIFSFILKYMDGIALERNIINELLDPLELRTIEEINEKINEIIEFYGWNCEVSIFSTDILNPSNITIVIECENKSYRNFITQIVIMFFVYNRKYDIKNTHERATSIRIDMILSDNPEKAVQYFGYMNKAITELMNKKKFWCHLIEIYIYLNYDIVAIPKKYCKTIKIDNITPDIRIFENLSKKLISEIPHSTFLEILKKTQESMNIIEKIDIHKDIVNISHSCNKDHVKELTDYYISLLKANGHKYEAKTTNTHIILTHV